MRVKANRADEPPIGLAPVSFHFGDLIDAHHCVGAWCPGVHGSQPLDMNVLIARLGRDWHPMGRRWLICCAVCRGDALVTIRGDQLGPAEREAQRTAQNN
jgi:hypothetical protein